MRVLRVLPVAVRMIAIAIAGIAATAAATWLLSRWMPVWAGAGSSVRRARAPECTPIPAQLTLREIVV